jgi:AcrR family transcriptional regulator
MMDSTPLRKGENTRARIVDAAYALFLEQGYHGTSMRQIADAAGITVGGIYNHFAGKEAIWEEVVAAKHPAREILPLLHEAQGTTVAEFVRAAAAGMVEALGHRPDFLKLMFIEIVEFNAKHVPGLFQAVMPEVARLGSAFAEKQGALRPLPRPLLARSFVGLFFSYYVTALFLPPEMQQGGEDALSAFVDIYLHGILSGEGNDGV